MEKHIGTLGANMLIRSKGRFRVSTKYSEHCPENALTHLAHASSAVLIAPSCSIFRDGPSGVPLFLVGEMFTMCFETLKRLRNRKRMFAQQPPNCFM